MRVCHIIEAGAAGGGNVVIDLARAGAESGDNVTVIYGRERTWPRFLEALKAIAGVKRVPADMRRSVGLHDVKDGYLLYKTLKLLPSFDVIHAHSSKAGALARLLSVFFRRSAIFYTPHAFISMAPGASKIYSVIESLLSWRCDAIICVSDHEKQHAQKALCIAERKLHVIPNGIRLNYPADRNTARTRLGVQPRDVVAGFVGRLESQKNPLRLIDAFANAAQQRPALRLAIIGTGKLQAEVESAIGRNNLSERVRFIDELNSRSLMPGFDMLVCTSDYEGAPLTVLEALAAGVPVIATPVGNVPEILSSQCGRITGFDADGIAQAIVDLADRTLEAKTAMSVFAKARAAQYSIEKTAAATRSLYTDFLKRRRKP